MARLYNKPYRRGGGRRGGYLKASPDPVSAADFPSGLTLPATSRPALLGTYTDPYNSAMTVQRISDTGGDFPSGTSLRIGVEYAKIPCESGNYVIMNPWNFPLVNRANGYAYVGRQASAGTHASRKYPGRFYGEMNSQTDWGYDDTYYNGNGVTTVFDGGATYSVVSFGNYEGFLDYNEEYVALLVRRTSDSVYEVKCVRISDGAVQGTWSLAQTSLSNFDNCTISAGGNYVIVQLTGTVNTRTAGLHVFDRSMTHQRQISIGGGGSHIDYGFLEDGVTEVAAWTSGSGAAVEYYRLDTGAGTTVISGSPVSPWNFYTHISMKAYDRPGYLYVSTFDDAGTDHTKPASNTITAIRLATGEIELWACAQHSEDYASVYNHSPFAVPSYDGKRVYFNSAWRSSTGTENALMYVVRREA
jgi:hypothetical protein